MLAREDSECMMKQRIFDERTFEERVNYGIDAYQMIRPGDTVIAAVSGGVDSVCLLLLLAARAAREATIFPPDPGEMAVGEASIRQGSGEAAPFRLQAVHVEHGIRGEESEADARFVEALCESLQIPVRIIRVDAPAYAAERGLSLEEAARELRYEAFERVARELHCEAFEHVAWEEREEPELSCAGQDRDRKGKDLNGRAVGYQTNESVTIPCVRVALAHHLEDQAETVLFNLARGTGLQGLGGMRPVRDMYIRPLLQSSRSEIEAYVKSRGTDWREDSTNSELCCSRNVIRHQILPVLTEEINMGSIRHICAAAQHAADAADYLEKQAAAFLDTHATWEETKDRPLSPALAQPSGLLIIQVKPLRAQERILREYILRRAVRIVHGGRGLKDFGEIHIRDLDALIFKPRGKHLDLPGRLKADRRADTLVLRSGHGDGSSCPDTAED